MLTWRIACSNIYFFIYLSTFSHFHETDVVQSQGAREAMVAENLVISGLSGPFSTVNGRYVLIDESEQVYRKQDCDDADIAVFPDKNECWCVQIWNRQSQLWDPCTKSQKPNLGLFDVRLWRVANYLTGDFDPKPSVSVTVWPNEEECATVSQGVAGEAMLAKTLVIMGVTGPFAQVNGDYNLDAKAQVYRKQSRDSDPHEYEIVVFSDKKGWCVQTFNDHRRKWVVVLESHEAGVGLFAVRSWLVRNPQSRRSELQESVRVFQTEQSLATDSAEGGNGSCGAALPEDGLQPRDGDVMQDEGRMLAAETLVITGQTLSISGVLGQLHDINGRYDLTDAIERVYRKQGGNEEIKVFPNDKGWMVESFDRQTKAWQTCLASEASKIKRGLFTVRLWFVVDQIGGYEQQPSVNVSESTQRQARVKVLNGKARSDGGSAVELRHRDVVSQHSPSSGAEETLEIQDSPQAGTVLLRQQIADFRQQVSLLSQEKNKLCDENIKLCEENSKLKQKRREMQALDSDTALGNNNIKGNFPFNEKIVASYMTLINDRLGKYSRALFGPCLGDGETISQHDILSCCKASKEIFTICHEWVQRRILDPQRKLKLGTMAAGPGEGARELSEWKVAQDSIIKLQRATRCRILKGLNDQLETHFEVCDYSQTLSHRDYKKNSQQYLGPFIKELVKVSYSLLLPLVHAI